MAAPQRVLELIELFDRNRNSYRSEQYNEARLRIEFLNPFFEALGWDINNKQGYAEAYKEVIYEDAIKIGGATKAPDYCFRVGGTRKFFVEAKKPAINLKEASEPSFQLRRYAWSAKLPLSILTDFEEFAIYDCRIKPEQADKAATARIIYLSYTDYVQRWDDIASIFSRDAILKGSFDTYAEATKGKRGTQEVDAAFLQEIESWREMLAVQLALRNKQLTQRELNFAVQMTIDRIIFLRICEDRGIEEYERLKALLKGSNVYKRLCNLFLEADERYNSGLFHFQKEKDFPEPPDTLTQHLVIDDKPLKEIVKRLYYPDSPYEFSVLPIVVLGQVYEQFLGKVIRLTPSHHVEIEEKPEVRKAGGVYYTPIFIVDYIVQHTLSKLLADKKPGIRGSASKIKIVDPACGSGSFLIVAYQYLLDWHRDHYIEEGTDKHRKELYQGKGGQWLLTTQEKKRILLNSIYGVDIDPQAVEVTKLSLLLKVLEGESNQSLVSQLSMFHERALPDLDRNIKCGNSLIGSDFYDDQLLRLFDEEDRYRINVFDWTSAFSKIMQEGGFDAVIGNPPYVDIKSLPEPEVRYIFAKYPLANNRINLFATFIEKSLDIVDARRFRFSMIVPAAFLTQDSYRQLRHKILSNYQLTNIVRLPNESFGAKSGDVKVDTVIVVFEERNATQNLVEIVGYAGYERITNIDPSTAQVREQVLQEVWLQTEQCIWSVYTTDIDQAVIRKCERNAVPLEKCAEISLGLTPYDKYKGHTQDQIIKKVFHADYQRDETFKRLLAGNDVMRYIVRWNGQQWISYGSWLGAPRERKFFTQKRILVKQIIDWTSKRIWASIVDEELYNTQNAFNLLAKPGWSLEYLLAILNSRLMTFYHRKKSLDEFKMRFQKILIKDCRQFPIHIVNFADHKEKARHDHVVSLVEQILSLHKRLSEARTPQDKNVLQQQIDATDRQIDKLVYELYRLTEEEIKIVEGKFQVEQ